jgi:hypothetical protein
MLDLGEIGCNSTIGVSEVPTSDTKLMPSCAQTGSGIAYEKTLSASNRS